LRFFAVCGTVWHSDLLHVGLNLALEK